MNLAKYAMRRNSEQCGVTLQHMHKIGIRRQTLHLCIYLFKNSRSIIISFLFPTLMDNTEEARQAYLDFLYSRLNAAFNAFRADDSRDEHAKWWHENLQIEMVCLFINFLIWAYRSP